MMRDSLFAHKVFHAQKRQSALYVQFAAAVLSVTAGVIHLVVTPEHAQEVAAWGLFFALVGMIQLANGMGLLLWTKRWLYGATAVFNIVLVAIYILFRFVPPPLAPDGNPETFEVVGLFTAFVETAVVVSSVYLMQLRGRVGSSR